MKILKYIVLGLSIAISTVGVSSVAMAGGEDGRISYAPKEAINLVLGKIKEAQDALAAGKNAKEVAPIIKEAKDFSKEINANDKVDIKRQRANIHLSKAIGTAKEGDEKLTVEHLNEAQKGFAELLTLL